MIPNPSLAWPDHYIFMKPYHLQYKHPWDAYTAIDNACGRRGQATQE